MFLTLKGNIYSFVYGVFGQLGLGDSESQNIPKKVFVGKSKKISNAIFHSGEGNITEPV